VTRAVTVAQALLRAAHSDRGITAIEHDARPLSIPYASLSVQALEIAAALQARGLTPGDRVALVIPEIDGFIRGFFGISAAGLVPVPLCPPAQAGDVATFATQSQHILDASRASAVVTSAAVAPLLDLSGLDRLSVLAIDELRGGIPLAAPVERPPDATALLQFTSGSTAAPKGVVLTHANLDANVTAIAGPHGLDTRSSDVGVSWLPLYHDMGLIGMLLAAVYAHLDTVIMSPVLFLKRPSSWLDTISRYKGTVSFAPNFAYELCVRRVKPSQIEALDLSSWRVAGCGAEPIRADTLRAFASHFAAAGFHASSFVASYGLAEHSLAVSFAKRHFTVDTVDAERLVRQSVAIPSANGSTRVVRLVACGRAFPEHELRIVDEEGRPLPDRHVGSIVCRGPSVMAGYFEQPAATAEALRSGWLYTGDLGYIADGQLFVCGRTKDLIIRQGRKYHPPDLEAAIAQLPGLRSSGIVVFAIDHLDAADEVVAVLEARASAASDDLEDQVRRRVRETAGLELDRVVLTPPGSIPRTTSGKVRRSETRERFRAGTL
jgi:fatty-acyl-CoA synthase